MSNRCNLNALRAMIFCFILIFPDMSIFSPDLRAVKQVVLGNPGRLKEKARELQIYLGVHLCLDSSLFIVSPACAPVKGKGCERNLEHPYPRSLFS